MKPDKADKIYVDSDISAASLLDCDHKIREILDPKYKHKLDYEVKVASQQMEYIIPLMYALGYRVLLDFTYDIDEWSLTGFYYQNEPFKRIEHTIWSPGS